MPQAALPRPRGRSSPAPRPWRRSSGRGARARPLPPPRCRRRGTCGSPCERRRAPPRRGSPDASRLTGQSKRGQYRAVRPLEGMLVVDLSRYLPGPFATRELLRLGARVVRVEPPEGDPMRLVDPGWDAELNAGKESVVCDLKAEPELARALCRRADVVVEGFRPGVAARLGLEPGPRTVWCSITGFGSEGRHAQRVGHDLNYLGWAGVLEATAPANPPVPVADFTGSFAAVREVLAALLERARTGRGARLEVSMTHEAHRLAAPPLLTGAAACYRVYECGDGRYLTVAALELRF